MPRLSPDPTSRLYLVVGPESSGTRLTTEILLAGGCAGTSGHRQPADQGEFFTGRPNVWRRSYPHHYTLPSIPDLVNRAPGWLDPFVVVTVRDPSATALSQHSKRTSYEAILGECLSTTTQVYGLILDQISRLYLPYTLSVYESLVLHPGAAQHALWTRLGLPGGTPVRVHDANAKRWQDDPSTRP